MNFKDIGDAIVVAGNFVVWLLTATLPTITLLATASWAIYRIYDLHLDVKLKRKRLRNGN